MGASRTVQDRIVRLTYTLSDMAKKRANGEGGIRKLPSGSYEWSFTTGYDKHGKQKRRTGTTKTKAEAATQRAEALTQHNKGTWAAPSLVTVAEYAERWLSQQPTLSSRTKKIYQRELGYALAHIGHLRLQEVRPPHLKDLYASLAGQIMTSGRSKNKPMCQATVGKVRTRVRALFCEAMADQLIDRNPAEAVKRSKTVAVPSEWQPKALDFDQMDYLNQLGGLLFAAGRCPLWPALFTALSLGLRRSEVMGLEWQDLDLERGLLHIRRGLVSDDGALLITPGKTANAERSLLIPASLKASLLAHRERQATARKRAGSAWQTSGAIFATALGTRTHPDNLNRALDSLCDWERPDKWARARRGIAKGHHAGLEALLTSPHPPLPHLTPHDLRHTFITLALRLGTPIEVVSRNVGHADIPTTMRRYRHVLESERRANVVDLFAGRVPAPSQPVAPAPTGQPGEQAPGQPDEQQPPNLDHN
jgi:integrase